MSEKYSVTIPDIDFWKNLGEYGFEIHFIDVRVEGDYAEQSIISAFKWFNKELTIE